MRIFSAVWLLLLCSVAAHAQILTIKDQVSREPLEVVTVHSLDPQVSALTDAKGQVDLSPFRGADSIHIRLIGYKPLVRSYTELAAKKVLLLEATSMSLNEVVVSASRWKEEARDVPNKIITIKPSEMALQNPQTAADLLGTTGAIYVQKSQMGGGSPMIRGFATNRVLMTVDGVRMNTAIFRSGNIQNVISLDPLSIERTEIVFGPGSVLYGSDAIGGVMSFHTLTPKLYVGDKPLVEGNVLARFGSANFEKTGHFDFNLGFEKWAFLTSVSYSDFDDLRMGSNGPDEYLRPEYVDRINGRDTVLVNPNPLVQVPTGYSQFNVMQKVRFRPNENWDVNYGFHYSATSDVPRYDRLIEYDNNQLDDGDWFYGPQLWMMHSLNVTNSNATPLYDNVKATLAYQRFEESRHNRGFGEAIITNRTETVDAFSGNIDFEKALHDRHLLIYGLEGIWNTVGSVANEETMLMGETQPTSTRYPDGAQWNSYAAYAKYRFKVSEKLALEAGARYNYVTVEAEFDTTFFPYPVTQSSTKTGAVTGSLGAAWQPAESWQVNANLSTGFRAPNVDDIGKVFDSEPGAVVVPNPNLQPEYAYNAEVGVAKLLGDFVKLNATTYYTILENALVRRDYTLNGRDSLLYDGEMSRVQAIQNASAAYVWGVQAGVDIELPKGFSISSVFNYQKGEEELEDGSLAPLRHVAPWFGSTHLVYMRNRFKADFYTVYNGEIAYEDLAPSELSKPHLYVADEEGNPYSPSWYTLNFKARYQLTEYLMLSAGVENITDQRYRPYSSGLVAPGRNFIASVKASF